MSPRRKKSRRPEAPVRKTNRRWRVPPPLTHGPEPLEGGTILEELATPLGGVLWETARDLSLWTATPAEERVELFSEGAAANRKEKLSNVEPPLGLASALGSLSRILSDAADADEGELAAACRAVADWAEEEDLLGIALAYTQAVALLREADPRVAYDVGVLALRRREDARAETWFRRAVMLARQNGDWSAYSLAFVALGNLYLDRDNHTVARKLHVRAKRAAHRHSLHAIEGMALHGLFKMAAASGDGDAADELAADALSALGPRHPRLAEFASDAARYWLGRGHPGPALEVLRAVVPHLNGSPERINVLAATARAAAEVGAADDFERAAGEVRALAASNEVDGKQALQELAAAEKILGQRRGTGSAAPKDSGGSAAKRLAAKLVDRFG